MLRRLCSLMTMLTGCQASSAPALPVFATPAWGTPGTLLLRADVGGSALLLRQAGGAVYRYQPAAKTLSPVSVTEWDHCGAIADCDRQLPALGGGLDGGAPSAGTVLATARVSPTGRSVVTVWAAGTRSSVMPFLGQGHRGPFVHQVRDVATGAIRSPPVTLPFSSKVSAVSACWSADERFVAYTDVVMSALVVVDLAR